VLPAASGDSEETQKRTCQVNRALLVAIAVGIAIALGVVTLITLAGCSAGWNDPKPIVPEPGNPCGYDWHSCGDGKCCYVTDDCRPGGYCAFGGVDGPTWGLAPDAGPSLPAMYRGLTPDQVRRQQESR
jgi:hypothetical protein